MSASFGNLRYLYIGTSDFKRDLEYYTKVLGAKVLWNYHEFDANVAGLQLGEGPQYLLADHRPAPSCLPLFEVEDLKATAKGLRARGWKADGDSVEIPPGPCYVFKDPSGNPIGIFENARPGLVAQAFGGTDRRRRAKG
jgi:catechol 2,3-dioxygenase-like lactoylglutathione lyase family enzyme